MSDEQAVRALEILYKLRMKQLGVTGEIIIRKVEENK